MEWVVLNNLGLVLGSGRPLGQIGSLVDQLGEVPDELVTDLLGGFVVYLREHAVANDGADLVLGGWGQDVLLTSGNARASASSSRSSSVSLPNASEESVSV